MRACGWLLLITFAAGCSLVVDNRLSDKAPAPQCRSDDDCQCTKGHCEAGRCTGDPEADGKDCMLPDRTRSMCMSGACVCSLDSQCADTEECNGAERCDMVLQVCVAGAPLSNGAPCGFDRLRECRQAMCVLPGP